MNYLLWLIFSYVVFHMMSRNATGEKAMSLVVGYFLITLVGLMVIGILS